MSTRKGTQDRDETIESRSMLYISAFRESVDARDYKRQRLQKLLAEIPPEERTEALPPCDFNDASLLLLSVDDVENVKDVLARDARAASERFPLADGELVEHQGLSALAGPDGQVQGSPVFLRQSTTMAEVFIALPGLIVRGDQVQPAPPRVAAHEVELEAVPVAAAALPPWVLEYATKLGGMLVSAVGSAVWDVVKKEVLGTGKSVPEYYGQVLKHIEVLLRKQAGATYVEAVKALTREFDLTIAKYNAMGRQRTHFEEAEKLATKLLAQTNSDTEPFEALAAFHFAEASVLHVMMLKENYTRLKEEGASRAILEGAKVHISTAASQYANLIERKRRAVVTARLSNIGAIHWTFAEWSPKEPRKILWNGEWLIEGSHGTGGQHVPHGYWVAGAAHKFEDSQNGFWMACQWDHLKMAASWHWADKKREAYRAAISTITYRDETAPMLVVERHLNEIAKNPVVNP